VTGPYAKVTAVGSALPRRIVRNAYFETLVDTSDEWIVDRTGIKERRFAGEGETTGSLSAAAAGRALEAAAADARAVDMLIVATCTPDRLLPATGAFVQARLGMSCPAFDLNAACAGFVYGLSLASAQIRAGAAERVLVIGAEVLSRVLNLHDRTTCVLFGDGAGAALLEPAEEPGVIDSLLAMDGTQAHLLTIPAGGSELPATPETAARGLHTIQMADGQAVFRQAVVAMASACADVLAKGGMSPSDVTKVIAHQANIRIITAVGKRLGIDPARVLIDIAEVGNTSAASIPIAMDRAWRSGKLVPSDVVLTVAFVAGMAWGANLLRWTAPAPDGAQA
jgi:3-oxoacyl-[acyl-carrier-protein] synthase-3